MVAELYGVIHVIEEALKIMSDLNVILLSFVLNLLLQLMLCGCFVIDEIFVLIFVGQSGLWLLVFFVNGIRVLIS